MRNPKLKRRKLTPAIVASFAPMQERAAEITKKKQERAEREVAAAEAGEAKDLRRAKLSERKFWPRRFFRPAQPSVNGLAWHSISRRAFVAGMGMLFVIPMGWRPHGHPDAAFAWSHGQVQGAPPPPQWPTPGPGTNYYLAESPAGSDSNSGLSTSAPFATITHLNSVISAATGAVTVNFRSSDTFQAQSGPGPGISTPAGVSSFTVQGLIGNTLPVIQSNANGGSGLFSGANATLSGLFLTGDGTSFGVIADNSTEVTYCSVQGFSIVGVTDTCGVCIVTNGTNVNINNCTIGGLSVSDATGVGIFCNNITGCSIKNNTIGYCGGLNTNTNFANTQSGFGIHTSDTAVTYGVQFTWSSGTPTNALIEIAYNVIHDCAWNVVSGSPGGPSGLEFGGGNLQWAHHNIVYNIAANPATYMGGTDFDSIDCGDTNCGTTLVEDNFCHTCFGGFIDFGGDASIVGPIIARYNLVVNCGELQNIGNAIIQGESGSGVHRWYCNTFVVMIANFGEALTAVRNAGIGQNTPAGFFANNLIYSSFPWAEFWTNGLAGTFTMANNGWSALAGGPQFYDFSFGTSYSSYASAKAAQSNFDQSGITGDPLFAQGITAVSWSAGTTSITTAVAHGLTTGNTVTIDGTAWADFSTSPTVGSSGTNGTFAITVTGSNTFTYPQASDPRGGGVQTLTAGGIWALGSTSGFLNTDSYKLGSSSSPYYRTGLNLVTAFSVSSSEINGSKDFYGDTVSATSMSVGCHQP